MAKDKETKLNNEDIPKYDYIVMGAGISGLTAAAILARKGKKVFVMEKSKRPGGVTSNYGRIVGRPENPNAKRFTFDSSLFALRGFSKRGEFASVLSKAGVSNKVKFVQPSIKYRIVRTDGTLLEVPNDFKGAKHAFQVAYKKEKQGIEALFSLIKKVASDVEKNKIPRVSNLSDESAYDLVKKYVDDEQFVEDFFANWSYVCMPPHEVSAYYYLTNISGHIVFGTSYIEGGSQSLVNALVNVIESNNGIISYQNEVERILTHKNKTYRIRNKQDDLFEAKKYIYAGDVDRFLHVLIEGEGRNFDTYKHGFIQEHGLSYTRVTIGLDCEAIDIGMSNSDYVFLNGRLNETYNSIISDRVSNQSIYISNYQAKDPSLNAPNRTVITVTYVDGQRNWRQYRSFEYRDKKESITKDAIAKLERNFPGIKSHIVFKEVSSPWTIHNFSGSLGGAVRGYMNSIHHHGYVRVDHTTPIKNLYLTSSWTHPTGGIDGAMISASTAIYKSKRNYRYTKPLNKKYSKAAPWYLLVNLLAWVFLLSSYSVLGSLDFMIKAISFTALSALLMFAKPFKGFSRLEFISVIFGGLLTAYSFVDMSSILPSVATDYIDNKLPFVGFSVLSLGFIFKMITRPTIGQYLRHEYKQNMDMDVKFSKMTGKFNFIFVAFIAGMATLLGLKEFGIFDITSLLPGFLPTDALFAASILAPFIYFMYAKPSVRTEFGKVYDTEFKDEELEALEAQEQKAKPAPVNVKEKKDNVEDINIDSLIQNVKVNLDDENNVVANNPEVIVDTAIIAKKPKAGIRQPSHEGLYVRPKEDKDPVDNSQHIIKETVKLDARELNSHKPVSDIPQFDIDDNFEFDLEVDERLNFGEEDITAVLKKKK